MTGQSSESQGYSGYRQPGSTWQQPRYVPPQQGSAAHGQPSPPQGQPSVIGQGLSPTSGQQYGQGRNYGQGQSQDQSYGQGQSWGQDQSYGQGQGHGQGQGYGQGQERVQGEGQGFGSGQSGGPASGPNLPPGLFGQAQPPAGPTTPDERLWGALSQFGMIVLGFIAPLVVYLVKGNESPFVKDHAAQGLNFAITQTIYYFVNLIVFLFILGFLAFPIGLLTLPLQAVLALVSVIVAGLAANRGERYRYPFFMALPIVRG